ncbi:peptidase family M28-domain-containing protein [Paraphoma chrysanthemicola]|nr:peptidase family M28-domain-containing protein [Paraphoma chrysanthemicola]
MFFSLPSRLELLSAILLLQTGLTNAYKPLSDSFLRAIPSPGRDIDPHEGPLLAPILIPRVPGTPGQVTAQHHFVNYFQDSLPKWSMEWQNSTSRTPVSGGSELPFANLIFKREPPWVKPGQSNLLTLVAHYDSKYQPEGFIGATDSAAPCAMLMHVAKVIDGYVQRMYDEMQELEEGGTVEMDMGVQILLLDGEEAFEKWTDEDSLYGSRALAQQWSLSPNPPSAKFYKYKTPLNQISLFLLLDLLGAASPHVPSYFPTTHWAYQHLSTIESRMRDLKLLESSPDEPFLPDGNITTGAHAVVSDDHLPFMGGGVDILHVIPHPFPHVWHHMEDDGDHLDMPTVRDWSKIVAAFALEWLDMMEVWDEPAEQ